MQKFKATSLFSAMIASSIVLTACGGSSSSDTTPNPNPAVPTTPTIPTNPVQTAVLTGTVISKTSNMPIAGATVNVDNLSATTDKDGKYTLSNLPTGTKNITVSANGFISQTIEHSLVAKNTLDVALVPAISINPTTPTNPTTPISSNTKNFSYTIFTMDFDDNGNIAFIENIDSVFYPNLAKLYFNTIYGKEIESEDAKNLYLTSGVTYIDDGSADSYSTTEMSNTYSNIFSDGNLTTTEKLTDKISGKSIVKKTVFYPISLFNDTTHSTFLNRLALMQNNTYKFPEGSLCYGSEMVEFTSYFDFDLTTPTDYKTLDEWKERYNTSREDNKPTYNTYQVGSNNDLTVTTVTIGNATKIREAIVKYQNIFYKGILETMPTNDVQALSKNNCLVYNDIAKNYMINEIKKYYK